MSVWWSVVLTAIGLLGFRLAAKKIWWAWYVNLGNQIIWAAYAIATEQWGFLAGVACYTVVFTGNAVTWTREHREAQQEPTYAGRHRGPG